MCPKRIKEIAMKMKETLFRKSDIPSPVILKGLLLFLKRKEKKKK